MYTDEARAVAWSHLYLWVLCVVMVRLGLANLSSFALPALALYLFPVTMFDRPKMTVRHFSRTPSPSSSRSSSRSPSRSPPLSPKALFKKAFGRGRV